MVSHRRPDAGAPGLPRRAHLVAPLAALTLGLFAPTALAPDDVSSARAKLAEIEAEVARIDVELESAAESYNGARYRLGEIETRIAENGSEITRNRRDLGRAQTALAARLRALYVSPRASTAEVLLTSSSVTDATERLGLLERISRGDANVVTRIGEHRVALDRARAELRRDRRTTERELSAARAERDRVAGLLGERRRVLGAVKGDLARLLRAKQAREQRAAAERARQARVRAQSSAPAEPTPAPAPSSSGSGAPYAALPSASGNAAVVQLALGQLGVPYLWGGASPSTGFDCSGLISYVYAQIGKSVPHYTGAIWSSFPRVPRDQLQPGDVIFYRPDLGHAGIYMGGGQYIHAPQTGDVVKVSSMSSRFDYQGAVRP